MGKEQAKGAVACGHPETAAAAVAILCEGGNAVDACIGALLTACVTEPILAAPGGGGFLMAYDGARPHLFDFFCDAPLALPPDGDIEFFEIHADFGETTQSFHIGAGAAATPGFLAGITAASQKLGRLPLSDLVEPALAAARKGVTITPLQARMFEIVEPIITADAQVHRLFAPSGRLLRAGEVFRNEALAEAFQEVGAGRLATLEAAMIEQCTAHGGLLEEADFRRYQVQERNPLALILGDTTLFLNPPPALGGTLSAIALQALVRLKRSDGPARLTALKDMEKARLSGNFDVLLAIRDDDDRPSRVVSRGTTHVSVVDSAGMAAAATVSNGEGNGRMVPGMGFMLNNMLGEEDLNPKGFHACEAGMRLSSMMAPTLALSEDGPITALGTGGSSRIRTAIFNVAANLLLENADADTAVSAPRLHFENGRLDVEAAGERPDLKALRDIEPELKAWRERSLYFGGVHVAESDGKGGFSGAGDPRRGGVFTCA
ncbi:gamma-glutamyltranspeptidase/glutathione hydrolase [Rhodopseudomonas julia]|uniref:Gamma-glutamyltranspeptidase/glutathione hydrolase n=1 Tax=Rhodopseudomonas julia TaxID=200617 RepID=A0ABU0C495_9BRAD|nr:gamma-glutamyltransferase [Rhodopseudomonas julia]MDQ0325324.1 gamma-glutamyltranspeptidase/glutathione hydrolase [Rhodopseudomonas julia]